MGIMYKLMKHKHGLEMDLAKRNERTSIHKQDKQFSAEYIIELCKFLAEKSQRNKQKQQTEYLECKQNAGFELEEIVEMEKVTDIDMEEVAAVPLIYQTHEDKNKSQNDAKQILMVKQHFNTQTVPTTTANSLQFQQDNKKDILQKIRNQIFERKRQRQLASMQRIGGVWRPW